MKTTMCIAAKATCVKALAIALCVVIPVVGFAAENGYKVKHNGGSIPNIKAGSDLRMLIDAKQISFLADKTEGTSIAASSIIDISYGQDVHRRIGAAISIGVVTLGLGALMALTKSKKHYIGLTWDDEGKKGGLAFQANKNEYRGVLAGLEGVTGKKAVNSDTMTVKN